MMSLYGAIHYDPYMPNNNWEYVAFYAHLYSYYPYAYEWLSDLMDGKDVAERKKHEV